MAIECVIQLVILMYIAPEGIQKIIWYSKSYPITETVIQI
jgi:hypothetical protein